MVDLSLVDPDNRRPVDWDLRREALDALSAGAAPTSATAKLWLIRTALALRERRPEPFAGAYRPVEAGPSVCAFTRGDDEILAVVPVREHVDPATAVAVPAGPWRDVLADRALDVGPGTTPLGTLLSDWGIALWERAP